MNEHCPHCNADLTGEPIPQEYIDKGYYGDKTHYSRKVGHEIRGVYDGVLFWSCPDCGKAWPRWTDGGRLTDAAADWVRSFNDRIAKESA
jgi:hypothetical protein